MGPVHWSFLSGGWFFSVLAWRWQGWWTFLAACVGCGVGAERNGALCSFDLISRLQLRISLQPSVCLVSLKWKSLWFSILKGWISNHVGCLPCFIVLGAKNWGSDCSLINLQWILIFLVSCFTCHLPRYLVPPFPKLLSSSGPHIALFLVELFSS